MNLGEPRSLPEPQFPHVQNGGPPTHYSTSVLQGPPEDQALCPPLAFKGLRRDGRRVSVPPAPPSPTWGCLISFAADRSMRGASPQLPPSPTSQHIIPAPLRPQELGPLSSVPGFRVRIRGQSSTPEGGQASGLNREVPPPPPEAGIFPPLLPAAAARGASATCGPPAGDACDSGKVGRLLGFSTRLTGYPRQPRGTGNSHHPLKFSSTSRFSQGLFPHLILSPIQPPTTSTYYCVRGFRETEGTESSLPFWSLLEGNGKPKRKGTITYEIIAG